MSSNLIRTIVAVLTTVLGLATAIFGCTTDAITGATTCSASWLTPELLGIVVAIMGFAHLILKALQGWAGLANKTVPVVPAAEAKPGVVTASQVASETKK